MGEKMHMEQKRVQLSTSGLHKMFLIVQNKKMLPPNTPQKES
jgi:hypothetical protein